MKNIMINPPIASSVGAELTGKNSGGLYINNVLVARLANVLSSRSHNNAVITGAAGVGKTTLMQCVAAEITDGSYPGLKNRRIFSINIDSLLKECYTTAAVGERFRNLFAEARCFDLILFIDEGHRLCAAGDANSLGNIVKPYLTDDGLQVVLATTKDEYGQFIEPDEALKRRFEEIYMPEPDMETTAKIVAKTASYRYQGLSIGESAVMTMVRTAARYTRNRHDPDRSLAALDYTAAWVRNRNGWTIADKDVYQAQAEKLGLQTDALSHDLRSRVRMLPSLLSAKYPAWQQSAQRLADALLPAMTRCARRLGPLCAVRLCGPDESLLCDAAETCARGLGFICDGEIITAEAGDNENKVIKPFLVNPHRALIVKTEHSAGVRQIFLEILRKGTLELEKGASVSFADAAVFIIDTEAGKSIGFGAAANYGAPLAGAAVEVCFGKPDGHCTESICCRFTDKLKEACTAAGITACVKISEEAHAALLDRFSTDKAWSETVKASEEAVQAIMESDIKNLSAGAIVLGLCAGKWTAESCLEQDR